MRWPIALRRGQSLIVYPKGKWLTGSLDESRGVLESNVLRSGTADLHWMLDADGNFYELTSMGLASLTIAQTLGLRRRVERYRVGEPQPLFVAQLLEKLRGMRDADLPMVSDLRAQLRALPDGQMWDRDSMSAYLGE